MRNFIFCLIFAPLITAQVMPSRLPTIRPTTVAPSILPTTSPTVPPTPLPSSEPTLTPSEFPSKLPTCRPSRIPTPSPTARPISMPSPRPTALPTLDPSPYPTAIPTLQPTSEPTTQPTPQPTSNPTELTQRAFWANYLKLVIGAAVAVMACITLSAYYCVRYGKEVENMSTVTVLCKELIRLEDTNKTYRAQLKLPPRSIPPETWAKMKSSVTPAELEEIVEVIETLRVDNSKLGEKLQLQSSEKREKSRIDAKSGTYSAVQASTTGAGSSAGLDAEPTDRIDALNLNLADVYNETFTAFNSSLSFSTLDLRSLSSLTLTSNKSSNAEIDL